MEQIVNNWYKVLWETKGCRFLASHRFGKYDKMCSLTLNIISVYIIAINLLVLFPNRSFVFSDAIINFSTITLSLLVFVISTLISSRDYKLKSQKFHECGREISILYDIVKVWKFTNVVVTQEQLTELSEKYHELLRRFDLNHENRDYELFISKNVSEYPLLQRPRFFKVKVWVFNNFDTSWKYWFFILLPLILSGIYLLCYKGDVKPV